MHRTFVFGRRRSTGSITGSITGGARIARVATLAAAAALAVAIAPERVSAQIRRSAGPDGGPPAGPGIPRGMPRSAQYPYAGVWNGTFQLTSGPIDRPIPIVLVFSVADSAKRTYTGVTIHPDGGRAPHAETSLTKGDIQWKQQNSGGGFWVYSGRFVTPDSLAGTVALRDWPQLPAGEKPPAGTFALTRRPPGA